MSTGREDFYEDDEPVEEVVAAFDRGVKGTTDEAVSGRTETLDLWRRPVELFTSEGNDTTSSAKSA